MVHKYTLAILGAASNAGAIIAHSMSAYYRLLLMDASVEKLALLLADVQKFDGAEAEVIHCCKDASWEADVIVVAVDDEALISVANRIKEVTTCKSVIHFTTNHNDENKLSQLLPHAAVVTVAASSAFVDNHPLQVDVYGSDKTTMDIAKEILTAVEQKLHASVVHNIR